MYQRNATKIANVPIWTDIISETCSSLLCWCGNAFLQMPLQRKYLNKKINSNDDFGCVGCNISNSNLASFAAIVIIILSLLVEIIRHLMVEQKHLWWDSMRCDCHEIGIWHDWGHGWYKKYDIILRDVLMKTIVMQDIKAKQYWFIFETTLYTRNPMK